MLSPLTLPRFGVSQTCYASFLSYLNIFTVFFLLLPNIFLITCIINGNRFKNICTLDMQLALITNKYGKNRGTGCI